MHGGQPNPTKPSDTDYTGQVTVFRVGDEFRILEISLKLGQVHFYEWAVGDEFVGLAVWVVKSKVAMMEE